jgi:5-hydroxyisourate hydrolase-like protein (transthyretin family)
MKSERVPSLSVFKSLPALIAIATLCLVSVQNLHAQSLFYLTFERSFSPNEETQLRIDYSNVEEPFHVRVLKPVQIEKFLDGQIQISRSYEEPRAALNPAYYLGEGLNRTKAPMQGFRKLLAPEFRQQWNGLLSPPLRASTEKKVISSPKKVIHEPPAGFEIVADFHLDLQRGGSTPSDQWWWFFNQGPSGSAYTVRTASLGKLPVGLFLVQAVQGDNEAQALLQVSNASVQIKQSSRDLAVRVIDRSSVPLVGVKIAARDSSGKWSGVLCTTNKEGECLIRETASDFDGKLVVKAQLPDGSTAFSDTDFVPIKSAASSMLIATDRPIFKPGQEVQFKAILRNKVDGALHLPPSHEVNVTLQRQDGSVAGTVSNVSTSAYGSISGKFALSEDDSPGVYRLIADVKGYPYAGELRVRDYVKPTYYLELVETAGALRAGQKFSYKIKAKRYAGGIPVGAKYEVFVYRKKFEVPQFVEERGGGLSTGTDYFGGAQTASSLSQPQRIFSSIQERTPENERQGMGEAWNTAAIFDADGSASGELTLPPLPDTGVSEWTYTLMFRAMDGSGSQAVLSKDFFQTVSPGVVAARFSKAISKPMESSLRCNVRVTTPEGDPLEKVTGSVLLTLTTPTGKEQVLNTQFTTNKEGYAAIPVPAVGKVGVLTAKVIATGQSGNTWSTPAEVDGSELLFIGEGGEAVRQNTDVVLYTDSTIVSPGETPTLYALLPDTWGNNARGVVWRTTAGEKIYATNSSTISGRSYSFKSEAKEEYGTGYFETLTVPLPDGKFREATLGFRIIPWNKRLKVAIQPQQEVGEPMKPFVLKASVTHADGTPANDTEVAIGIVDRAVYAVQPEFRPSIFDFFYPMPRLNLMTFYSDELQGYGYADSIRKPNFSLSALKSQAKLSMRTARDTAGWYPHLVTNQYGEVSITVPMPSNLTEWVVTAVAVDKSGKVGESTAEFRTAVDVEVEPRVPQFLRGGDEVTVPMTVVNHLKEGVSVTARLSAEQDGEKIAETAQSALTLKANSSEVVNLGLNANRGRSPVYLAASMVPVGSGEIKLGGQREFEITSVPRSKEVVISSVKKTAPTGVSTLDLQIPEGARGKSIKLLVSKGLLGLLLTNAESLVTYPYGCTEQLAHSTLPNIALVKIADGLEGVRNSFKDYGALVAKAKANAIIGVKRIVANQKPSGGFSLWPSDPVESPAITLMAMRVLQLASEIGVTEADKPMWKAASWLETATRDRVWSAFELMQLTRTNGSVATNDQEVEFVRRVVTNPSAQLAELVLAALITQRYDQMSWHSFNTKIKVALSGMLPTPHLLERISGSIDNQTNVLSISKGTFSSEDLGFVPSPLYLLAMTLEALPSGDNRFATARAKVLSIVFDMVRNDLANSPFDRARLLEAVLPIVTQETGASVSDSAISASFLGGKRSVKLHSIPGGAVGSVEFESDAPADISQITFQGVSADSLIAARAVVEVPNDTLKSVKNGFTVARTLRKIVGKGTVALKPEDTLALGDVVVSELTVSREDSTVPEHSGVPFSETPSEWIAVRDGVPSIAEGVDNDRPLLSDAGVVPQQSGVQITQGVVTDFFGQVKETLRYSDRIERVVRLRPGEKYTSYIVWRVSFSGKATVPPAEVFDMYAGSIRAATEEAVVSAK